MTCGRPKIGRPTKCKNKGADSVVVVEEAKSVIPMEEAAALEGDATRVTPVEAVHMSPGKLLSKIIILLGETKKTTLYTIPFNYKTYKKVPVI